VSRPELQQVKRRNEYGNDMEERARTARSILLRHDAAHSPQLRCVLQAAGTRSGPCPAATGNHLRAAFHGAVGAAMGGVCSVCAWCEDGGDGIFLQTPSNLNDVLKLRVFSLFQNTDRNVHHETDFIRATAKH
jgi:hypothetical protein